MEADLKSRMASLPDGELLEIANADTEEFSEAAISAAKEELLSRGGENETARRISDEQSIESAIKSQRRTSNSLRAGTILLAGGFSLALLAPSFPATKGFFFWGSILLLFGLFRSIKPLQLALDPETLAWKEAVQQARDSVEELRALASGQPAAKIRFEDRSPNGAAHYLWGTMIALSDSEVFLDGSEIPWAQARLRIPLAEILDWEVVLPNGTVRGGFTKQAELALYDRAGVSPPKKQYADLVAYTDRLRATDGGSGSNV